MKTAKQLGEEIQALQAKVKAIQDVASQDNRDLLADEQAEIDAIVGTDGKAGQIENLSKERERAIRIESAVSNTVRQVNETRSVEASSFRIPATARATGKLKAFKGPDAERDAYKAGQFFRALNGNAQARQWCRDNGVLNAMGENDDLRGGVLVPPEFETSVISLMETYGVTSRYARTYPMGSDTVTIPRRVSGLTAYAVGEAGEITASDPALGQVSLTAHKWATLTRVSNELNEDAVIAIADYLAMEMAQAHALKLDQAAFLGDGTTAYGGINGLANVLAAGSVATAAAGQNTAANLTIAVFQEAVGKLPEFAGMNPVWFCHKAVFWNVLARLQLAAGGNNYVDLGSGPVLQFMGYPVQFTQVMPSTISGGTKLAYIGDLSMASTLGLRRGVSVVADSSRYMEFDQTAFRSITRWDYNVHEIGDASNAGPIVQVKAAA
jgi:HK97 family phage major capsid protein